MHSNTIPSDKPSGGEEPSEEEVNPSYRCPVCKKARIQFDTSVAGSFAFDFSTSPPTLIGQKFDYDVEDEDQACCLTCEWKGTADECKRRNLEEMLNRITAYISVSPDSEPDTKNEKKVVLALLEDLRDQIVGA